MSIIEFTVILHKNRFGCDCLRRVVLLAVNSKYVHSALSVWLLKEGVRKYSRLPHDVEVVEATIHQTDDDIVGLVAAHCPDVVGVSTYI